MKEKRSPHLSLISFWSVWKGSIRTDANFHSKKNLLAWTRRENMWNLRLATIPSFPSSKSAAIRPSSPSSSSSLQTQEPCRDPFRRCLCGTPQRSAFDWGWRMLKREEPKQWFETRGEYWLQSVRMGFDWMISSEDSKSMIFQDRSLHQMIS